MANASHNLLGMFDRFAGAAVLAVLLAGFPLSIMGFIVHSM